MKKIIISIIIIAVVVSVGAGFWYIKNKGLPPEAPNGLMIYSLKAGDEISSPLEISGYVYANGWGGFEGQVGSVRLLDNNGNEIALAILTATSDWMTDKINFSTILEFESLNSQEGVLVFMNENPSGLAENSREFNLPVRIAVTASETMKVKVYYSNSVKDPELFCENVYSVEREIPKTEGVARAALEELLKGPTDSEKAEGFSTGINPGVTIQSLTIEDGIAKVDFNAQLEYQIGGSCLVTAIRRQIIETLKQFPTISDVVISIDGRIEDILQP